jgi:hypothetical protein
VRVDSCVKGVSWVSDFSGVTSLQVILARRTNNPLVTKWSTGVAEFWIPIEGRQIHKLRLLRLNFIASKSLLQQPVLQRRFVCLLKLAIWLHSFHTWVRKKAIENWCSDSKKVKIAIQEKIGIWTIPTLSSRDYDDWTAVITVDIFLRPSCDEICFRASNNKLIFMKKHSLESLCTYTNKKISKLSLKERRTFSWDIAESCSFVRISITHDYGVPVFCVVPKVG